MQLRVTIEWVPFLLFDLICECVCDKLFSFCLSMNFSDSVTMDLCSSYPIYRELSAGKAQLAIPSIPVSGHNLQ